MRRRRQPEPQVPAEEPAEDPGRPPWPLSGVCPGCWDVLFCGPGGEKLREEVLLVRAEAWAEHQRRSGGRQAGA